MKVAVNKPFRVVHEGVAYTHGDTPDVPDHVGAVWVGNGWATGVTEPEKAEQEDNDDGHADSEGARGADRSEARKRAGGTARAASRRG